MNPGGREYGGGGEAQRGQSNTSGIFRLLTGHFQVEIPSLS